MKIKETIKKRINNPQSRMRIGQGLGVDSQAIYVLLKENADNGRLTKLDALLEISKETGVAVLELCDEPKRKATAA